MYWFRFKTQLSLFCRPWRTLIFSWLFLYCEIAMAGSFHQVSYPIPFHDNFDSLNLWTIQTVHGSNWQRGLPFFGQTNSTHSGSFAWDVELNATYQDRSVTMLYSPLIDFNGLFNARLSFWQNFNTESHFDGTRLDYTVDGINWIVLGVANDPEGNNWYSFDNIGSSNKAAWSGSSGGWINSSYTLVPLNGFPGQVQFRFVFTSDDSLHLDGHSIDDFAIDPAPNQDASTLAIIQPQPFSLTGNTDTVTVIIKNTGGYAVDSMNVLYQVNGNPPISQSWHGHLLPAYTDTVTFALPFTAPAGAYSLCAIVQLPSDGNSSNDEICKTVFGASGFSIPYFDSFDSSTVDWFDSSRTGTNWQLGMPSFGFTNSTWSGSQCWDINLNSVYHNNAVSFLYSSFFDFTGIYNAKLSFEQNRNTEKQYDGMVMEATSDGGLNWFKVGDINEENSSNWYNDSSISSFSNSSGWDGNSGGWQLTSCVLSTLNNGGPQVQFRFNFSSDGSNTGDGVSIDDFRIIQAPVVDLSLNKMLSPLIQRKAGDLDSILVRVRNLGSSDITSFVLWYGIQGSALNSYNWNGTLHPSEILDLFLDTLSYRNSDFTLVVINSLPGDGDPGNDTLREDLFGIPVIQVPFHDDFESQRNFFTPQLTGDWQWGIPHSNLINHAYSGNKCWKTNLGADYGDREYTFLYSPLFDFSNAYHPVLKFRHWYSTEQGQDGGRIDFSKDGGLTWKNLGSRSDALGTSWYSNSILYSSGRPGWDGNSNPWILSTYNLDSLSAYAGGLIQFRFNFSSNDSVRANGWAIDDFTIESMPAISASPTGWTGLPDPFFSNGIVTPGTYIRNSGAHPLQSVQLHLFVDGVMVNTDTVQFVPKIPSGDSLIHTFSSPLNLVPGSHSICIVTSDPNQVNDQLQQDDTNCVIAGVFDTVNVNNSSWCDDFENISADWLSMNPVSHSFVNSGWSEGNPSKQILNGVYNGIKSWTTRLTNDYSAHSNCALFSPVLQVDSNACYSLSFYHRYSTELFQDGGTVEYSTDNGSSWQILGRQGDLQWFNSNYISGLGLPPTGGWSGSSSSWTQASHEIYFPIAGPVIFRFRFGSDASIQDEGWEIDQVCLSRIASCSIGIEELSDQNILVYPNPANDHVFIVLPEIFNNDHFDIRIENALGQEQRIIHFTGQQIIGNKIEFDISGLSQGIYFLKITSGMSVRIAEILKK